MVCKELEERTSEQNIDLGFNKFCAKTSNDEFAKLVKTGYIAVQYKALQDGGMLADWAAINIARQIALDFKANGCLDILNRSDTFVFNED